MTTLDSFILTNAAVLLFFVHSKFYFSYGFCNSHCVMFVSCQSNVEAVANFNSLNFLIDCFVAMRNSLLQVQQYFFVKFHF